MSVEKIVGWEVGFFELIALVCAGIILLPLLLLILFFVIGLVLLTLPFALVIWVVKIVLDTFKFKLAWAAFERKLKK